MDVSTSPAWNPGASVRNPSRSAMLSNAPLSLCQSVKREHLSAADLKAGLPDCLIEPAKVTAMAWYDNDSIDAVLNQAFAVSMNQFCQNPRGAVREPGNSM